MLPSEYCPRGRRSLEVLLLENDWFIETVAGSGEPGFADSLDARAGMFKGPGGAFIAPDGSVLIADLHNHRIRVYEPSTGALRTIVGNGQAKTSTDGAPIAVTSINCPHASAADNSGRIFAAESYGHVITLVDCKSGVVKRVAGTGEKGFSGDDGPALDATLHEPAGIAFDLAGNMYFNDFGNNRIRMIDATGIIRTVAGTGEWGHSGDGHSADLATLAGPYGVACDQVRNHLYIADHGNACIRRVDLGTGIIETVAGCGAAGFAGDGGPAQKALLREPHGVAVDREGNIYIADTGNARIRRVERSTGRITTIAGTGAKVHGGDGGHALDASFIHTAGVGVSPAGDRVSPAGDVYVPDYRAHRLRRLRKR